MASTLVTGIGELVTCDPTLGDETALGILHDAALSFIGDQVVWVGAAADAPACDETVDAEGRCVVPGFVDSHTHLVFAGDRAAEFAARMAGQAYTGGGIRTTVAATRAATDEQLRVLARARAHEMAVGVRPPSRRRAATACPSPTRRAC
jgi:imidazolonepropionase